MEDVPEGEGRARSEEMVDVAVVGGGVAGLTAASLLGRAGLDVLVFERRREVGGRARSSREDGFVLDEGPHALYRTGSMARVSRALGVDLSGDTGPTWNAWAVREEKIARYPVSVPALLATSALGWGEKWELGRLMAVLPRRNPAEVAGTPVGPWIERELEGSRARDLVRALVRLTTYCPEDDLDAAAALAGLRKGSRGALYLDGGWQTLVRGLRRAAGEAGASVRTADRVRAVERDGASLRLHRAEGHPLDARFAVLAVGPSEAARLLEPAPPSLRQAAETARPLRAACLSLGLERRPEPDRALALGVDEPMYASDYAGPAAVAPRNGALIHAVLYLGGRTPSPEEDRARIERFLDRVHPGWRRLVQTRQYLPGAVVSHHTPLVAAGGLAGRYGPAVDGAERVFVAGDWVAGPDSMLSDAAAASARRAATSICELHDGAEAGDVGFDGTV